MTELSDLTPLAPSVAVDRRVRARCHEALTAGTAQRIAHSPGRRVVDGLLALAAVAYGVAILAEGLNVIGAF
jgi:hypothetical protein